MASAGVPMRRPEATIGGRGSNGHRVAVDRDADRRAGGPRPAGRRARTRAGRRARGARRCRRSARSRRGRRPSSSLGDGLRAGDACAAGARGTARSAAIFSATALPAITCSSGPPCWPGNTAELIFLACSSLAEDHPAARAAERLVDRRRDHVGVRHRVGVQAGGDEAGEVGHVDHQLGADLVGDLAEAREVELARVGRPAGEDQLRAGARSAIRATSSMSIRQVSGRTS